MCHPDWEVAKKIALYEKGGMGWSKNTYLLIAVLGYVKKEKLLNLFPPGLIKIETTNTLLKFRGEYLAPFFSLLFIKLGSN